MELQGRHWAMAAGAVMVTALLALAPRTPDDAAKDNAATAASARVSEDPNSGSTPHAQDGSIAPLSKDPDVAQILAELNSGGPPMPTIQKLLAFADAHPDNMEAQYQLGILSWNTGQYDKAMARFRTVVAHDPKGHPDAYAFLAQAYGTLDSTDKAIAAIETYKTLVTDTALQHEADRLLTELRTKKHS